MADQQITFGGRRRFLLRAILGSFVFAVLPALGLYAIVSYAAGDTFVWLFGVGLAAFAAMLYPKDDWRARAGASLIYLAVEAFLFPVAVLVVAVGQVSNSTDPFRQVGAGVLVMMSWLVSWSIGFVLYYVSGRYVD